MANQSGELTMCNDAALIVASIVAPLSCTKVAPLVQFTGAVAPAPTPPYRGVVMQLLQLAEFWEIIFFNEK